MGGTGNTIERWEIRIKFSLKPKRSSPFGSVTGYLRNTKMQFGRNGAWVWIHLTVWPRMSCSVRNYWDFYSLFSDAISAVFYRQSEHWTICMLKPNLRRLVAGFPPRRPCFEPESSHVEFVVDEVALGQVFSEYFGFPCQFAFHRLLHNHHHLSSGAGIINRRTKWTQSHPTKNDNICANFSVPSKFYWGKL
jgi:hypothetical protein